MPNVPKLHPAGPHDKFDHLKHFKADAPGWRLAALVVWRLPWILASVGGMFTTYAVFAKVLH